MVDIFPILTDFIKSTTVSTKVSEATVRVNTDLFLQHDSEETTKWRKARVQNIFPSLLSSATPASQQTPPTALTAEAIAAIITVTTQANASTTTNNQDADTTQSDTTLGLSESVYKKILTMCGIAPGQEDEIPDLW